MKSGLNCLAAAWACSTPHTAAAFALEPGVAGRAQLQRRLPKMLLAQPEDIKQRIAVGDIVVPLARPPGTDVKKPSMGSIALWRQLASRGLYAGVEYRVLGIAQRPPVDAAEARVQLSSVRSLQEDDRDGLYVTLRPTYRLDKRYERKWPIEVRYQDLPLLLTPAMHNFATAVNALTAAALTLALGFLGRMFVMLCYIPSYSMEPSIQSRDLVVVERVSHHLTPLRRGEIVAFSPPDALKDIMAAKGDVLTDKQYFVKRIACVAGDTVELGESSLLCVTPSGSRVAPPHVSASRSSSENVQRAVGRELLGDREVVVPKGSVYVVGDNPRVSVDSRVWGCLESNKVAGRVFWRLLPLDRFGPVL